MKHNFPTLAVRPTIGAVLLFGLFATQGCKKPEDELGLNVLDPSNLLGYQQVDTSTMISWSKRSEALQTSGGLSTNVLGSYLDDRFGQVTTGVVTQVRLSTNNVGPQDPALVCDSLVLSLAFADANPTYGDLDPQIIKVHRLTEDLHLDSVYKCDHVPTTDGVDLVVGSPRLFTPVTNDGPIIGGDSLPAQVRIPLALALGEEFLDQWGQTTFSENSAFLTYFKGFYIFPDNGPQAPLQAGTWNLNLLNGASKLTLYYHGADNVATKFDFIIGGSSARYNTSAFDYGLSPDPAVPQALADTTLGQQEIYIQAMGGIRSEVRFPGLENFTEADLRALAKAELVVPISGEFHDTYTPPSQLFAFRKGDEGQDLLVPDQISGQGQVGGLYDGDKEEYRLNLTRWVQGVLNGTYENTGLGLVAGSSGISVARATLGGPEHPTAPMKLLLTFTTY